uniref:Uncharacterized protein n=1 Tax=Mycena chlorophos TaxID=658473 RepID=A0ABQ0KUP0_MYCCL|nr:predicted protein [Mycena chlorophos]
MWLVPRASFRPRARLGLEPRRYLSATLFCASAQNHTASERDEIPKPVRLPKKQAISRIRSMLSVEEPEWRQFAASLKHHFAFAGADLTRTWAHQDPQVKSSVFEAAEAALPQLRRAEDNWMLKSILIRHFSSLRYKYSRYPKEEKVSRSSVQWKGKTIPCPRNPTRTRIKRLRDLLGVDSREWYGIRASLRLVATMRRPLDWTSTKSGQNRIKIGLEILFMRSRTTAPFFDVPPTNGSHACSYTNTTAQFVATETEFIRRTD